jgi:proteasome assembly chaperone (PAC2) family protein
VGYRRRPHMHDLLRPVADFPPLRDPILIAGFADNHGTTAASAVAYLVERWDGHLLAEIDPEELFDFTVRRPLVRAENGERVLEWPTSRLYVARPAGAARDVVLLVGVEPHLRWRAFCEAIVSFMHEVGATTSLTVGSYPAPTPHTRPVPLLLSASDDAYGRTFGLEPIRSSYEGPTGIVGVLNVHLAKACRTASLSTRTPFYVGAEQYPQAMIALIEAIDRGLGTSTPVAVLHERAATLEVQADQVVRQSESLKAFVGTLEEQFDTIRGSTVSPVVPGNTGSALPSSAEVIAGLESFLREQRRAGGSEPNGNASVS